MDADDKAYEVEAQDDAFAVVSPTGANVLACRDEANARHYAVLLTAAWRAGYKEGYRATGASG